MRIESRHAPEVAISRFAVFVTLLALSIPPAAHAAGVNLSWDACGATGQPIRSSACDTNSGPANVLIGSVVAPAGMKSFEGYFASMKVQSDSPNLPSWWQVRSSWSMPNACRDGAVAASVNFSGYPTTCADFFAGRGIVWGVQDPAFPTPNSMTFVVNGLVGSTQWGPLSEGVEYYMFALTITNAKTVGVGACAGCSTGVCVSFESINLVQHNDLAQLVTGPALRDYVTWNNPSPSTCAGSTPVRASTWGQVKSLYR